MPRGRKGGKAGRRRVKRGRPRVLKAGRRGSLQGAITGLNAYRVRLMSDRTALDARISAIESALSAMGGTLSAGRPGRGRRGVGGVRAGSLKDHIGRVLSGRGVMTVRDIKDSVLKSGYKTKNKTLGKSVGIALTQMPGVVKVGRGQFKLK